MSDRPATGHQMPALDPLRPLSQYRQHSRQTGCFDAPDINLECLERQRGHQTTNHKYRETDLLES